MPLLKSIILSLSYLVTVYTFRRYQYDPLGPMDIHLVRFGLYENTDWLSCGFRVVNLDHLPVPYTAISYCWGDSNRL